MASILAAFDREFRRYKRLSDAALAQLSVDELNGKDTAEGNSIATIAWHIAGNLRSRFVDFLTSDGEKPWRQRDSEFSDQKRTAEEVASHWQAGWESLFEALAKLNGVDLESMVTIRGIELTIHEALGRSLAHTSYHVGQIVLLARRACGDRWQTLSIPKGGSEKYNKNPNLE